MKKKQLKRVLVTATLVLLVVGVAAFAADVAAELTKWQLAVASAVAVVIGIPIVQWLKKTFMNELANKTILRVVAYGVSFLLGFAAIAFTGGLKGLTFAQMLGQGSIIFAAMTVVYTAVADKFELSRN